MSYYKANLSPNPIDILLTKLSEAEAKDSSDPSHPLPDLPTLDHFLAEEDVLRECRSENEKLIEYICRPETIRQLVDRCFDVPIIPTESSEVNGTQPNEDSPPEPDEVQPFEGDPPPDGKEKRMKFAYVASELLTSDNKLISDAVVEDEIAMKKVFGFLQDSEAGKLNSIVAVQFSKIVINLLKMKNSKVLELMDNRGYNFVINVLKHMDSLPIAELVVRILDNPEPEPPYGPPIGAKPPTDEALELLNRCNLLEGLAGCFVKASCGDISDPALGLQPQEMKDTTEISETDNPETQEEDAQRKRLREETMANVSMTILGLTERLLQFPVLGVSIPESLSPYRSPAVIVRLLDAGLYANCSGKSRKTLEGGETSDENVERVEAFSKGNTSALVHSLGLAADLLTTGVNVIRDDDDDLPHTGFDRNPGMSERGGMGFGKSSYSGRGIAPSIGATDSMGGRTNENGDAIEKPAPLPELLGKKAGDPIVESHLLEAELAIRFARLSEMFEDGDIAGELGRAKPLGSLRLKLAEFFVACMKKGSQETVDQINDLKVPKKLLELFTNYPWSSMLHGVVTKSIVQSLEDVEVGRPARQAWLKAGLVSWLMDSWARNIEAESRERGSSAGYMGHLIRIGTALKGYIEENRLDPNADLPEESEIESFDVFGEEALAPAHSLEATPLCDDRADSDEGEEARDVLDMGGISLVEGLSPDEKGSMHLKYASFGADNVVDDDEEIKTVDVDDLAHFGSEEIHIAQPVDHDIPREMREEQSKIKLLDDKNPQQRQEKGTDVADYSMINPVDYSNEVDPNDELKGVIDTVDSSSDEEGSYVAFVDDQRDSENVTSVTEKLDRVKIDDDDATASSIAGAVTEIEEIEEPGAIGSGAPLLPSLASNVVTISDDDTNSSDEEYEVWEDASNPISTSESATAAGPTSSKRVAKAEPSRKVG